MLWYVVVCSEWVVKQVFWKKVLTIKHWWLLFLPYCIRTGFFFFSFSNPEGHSSIGIIKMHQVGFGWLYFYHNIPDHCKTHTECLYSFHHCWLNIKIINDKKKNPEWFWLYMLDIAVLVCFIPTKSAKKKEKKN